MNRFLVFSLLFGLFTLQSCKDSLPSPSEGLSQSSSIQSLLENSALIKNSFTGLIVKEADSGETLFEQNANKYFTPASNTKLFSFYASLHFLEDRLPSLEYLETDSSFIFWGTGDPTFLHRSFPSNVIYDFLKSQSKPLVFSTSNFYQPFYGPGWSWDDYNDYYQVENTSFPIYGNTVDISLSGDIVNTDPSIFLNTTFAEKPELNYIKRALSTNEFFVPSGGGTYNKEVPIKTSALMTQQLLMDTLKVNVSLENIPKPAVTTTFYGLSTEPVLAKMMKESDNFLAEQLLILSSSRLSDTLNNEVVIDHIKNIELSDSPDALKWVDGSGLSRYNLFTPASIAHLLYKMRQEFGESKILPLMAQNGKEGTLSSFSNENGVFLYAKSGTLSGVYNLSGYVKTASGKTLIVSCMHNNFNRGASEFRKFTADLYQAIYYNY